MTRLAFRPAAALALALGLAAAATPADVVILKDGFVIQGTHRKEMESVSDKATGQTITVAKGNGFDYVDDGARVVVFSTHHKQLGEIAKDASVRPDYKAYQNPMPTRKDNKPLPGPLSFEAFPDFDAKWRRTLKANAPEGYHLIDQQVTYLDPYCCYVTSPSYLWTQTFRTSEMDPQKVRKLLSTHPTLVEADGKPDPVKRLAIATFLKDAGWLQLAKEDVDRVRREFPGPLPKEAQDRLDAVGKEVDSAVADLAATEAENALKAGRYGYAADLVAAFPHKTAGPKEVDRITAVAAQVKAGREGAAAARRLLRAVIDEATGAGVTAPLLAAAGPAALLAPAREAPPPRVAALAAAAEQVLAEVHPDTAGRVQYFIDLAGQAEKDRAGGKPASKSPEELLAVAASGWAKGKAGATEKPDAAAKVWAARTAALAYQRNPTINGRAQVLADYKRAYPLGANELTQVISLLPPAEPEDLAARTGTPVKAGNGGPDGIYRRKSAPVLPDFPAGVDYLVRLPPEYHHGRAYPVLVVIGYGGLEAERMMAAVAAEADRHGYILLAPDWAGAFAGKTHWEWKPEDHGHVTGALRDAVRHFTVDNDRVFLLGLASGADAAMDVGISHPDLFAGVIPVGANPRWQGLFIEYWRNAQKLPFYVVTGQFAPGNDALTRVFGRWMPNGFPGVRVTYRGRAVEWFPAEVPVMFDWMGRKARANGTATLQLGGGGTRHPWQIAREGDNRFYWLGADKVDPRNLSDAARPTRTMVPARLDGDIKGNTVSIRSQGVRTISAWLGKDMIDWAKPVAVSLNGNALPGWRPKVLEPDMGVLLEDYWLRGDRRMLYLNRIEFNSVQ